MTETPPVTGTITEMQAAELGPEHEGRHIRFHADGALVHGIISEVSIEWGGRRIVALTHLDYFHALAPTAEVVIITETAAEATTRLGQGIQS